MYLCESKAQIALRFGCGNSILHNFPRPWGLFMFVSSRRRWVILQKTSLCWMSASCLFFGRTKNQNCFLSWFWTTPLQTKRQRDQALLARQHVQANKVLLKRCLDINGREIPSRWGKGSKNESGSEFKKYDEMQSGLKQMVAWLVGLYWKECFHSDPSWY